MTKEALQARNEYRRKWARENRDKIRAQHERYWAKKAAAAAEGKQEAGTVQTKQ